MASLTENQNLFIRLYKLDSVLRRQSMLFYFPSPFMKHAQNSVIISCSRVRHVLVVSSGPSQAGASLILGMELMSFSYETVMERLES